MIRQEAIRKLQKQKAEYLEEWVDFSGVAEAYNMAIEALSEGMISRAELFNKLATVNAPMEANAYKAEVYRIINEM